MTGGAASPCQARFRGECQPGWASHCSPSIPAAEGFALPTLPWSPGHVRGAGKGSGHCRHLQRGHRADIQKPDTSTSLSSVLLDWGHLSSPSGTFPLPGPCTPRAFQPVDTLALSQAPEVKCKKGREGHSSVLWRGHRGFGTVMTCLLWCCRGTSRCLMLPSPGARPASAREHTQGDLANPKSCKSTYKPQQFNSKASGRAWPRRSRVCGLAPSLPCGHWVLPPGREPAVAATARQQPGRFVPEHILCLLNGEGLFFPVDIDHNCYPID